MRTAGFAVDPDLVWDIIRLNLVFDERTKTARSSEALKILRACATYATFATAEIALALASCLGS